MYKVTIEDINDYLSYKRNLGFKYQTVEFQLKNFLKYYGIISDENIDKWINNIKFSDIYKKGLASTINEFIKYLINIKEIKNINLIDIKKYRCQNNFVPRIYTENEIQIFFSKCYKYISNNKNIPYKKEKFTLIYKLAYCTGLRTCEIKNIKVENINYNDKSIFIKSSKNNIDRYIYVDENILSECKNIIKLCNLSASNYLFCTIDYSKLGKSIILNNFRDVWLKIFPNDDVKTLRVHNFRHSFAVHNLKRWFLEKEDLYSKLPILMTYMGHSNISSTEYYLRMLPDVFPNVIDNYKNHFGNLIEWRNTNE